MFGKGSDIYRAKALERLSSPEAVDQLLSVVSSRDWLPLLGAALLISVLLSWSYFGSVPTAVTGRGVLIHPQTIVESLTPTAGRLEALTIKPGDYINKGDVIGTVDQADLRNRLAEDRRTLAQRLQQDRLQSALQDRQAVLQTQQISSERNFIRLQSETLNKNLSDARTLQPLLRRRLDGFRTLRGQGLISEVSADLLQSEQAVLENDTKITDIEGRLQQLDGNLRDLETREADFVRQAGESSSSRRNELEDLRSRISVAEQQLERDGEIRSEHSGRVVEVTAAVGQVLGAGARLATVEAGDQEQTLVSVSYFPVADGKRIQPGMLIQVTPDTVERQRFGGIIGVVESVSDLPVTKDAAVLLVGNREIVDLLVSEGPYIQVTSRIQADPSSFSGYRWSASTGPELRMSSGLTTTSRITVEERAPVSYIFPFLRSVSGVY